MSNEPQNPRLHPIRAILNGALAWALGFALYMLPGIGIGMKMGYELGVQGVEKDEIPRQIQATVQNFYHGNRIVGLAAACVMGAETSEIEGMSEAVRLRHTACACY